MSTAHLQTEAEMFQYVSSMPQGEFAFITGNRKYSSGCVFCAYLLLYTALEFHNIDPYSEFGILRGNDFFYVINDMLLFDYFLSFCQATGNPLPCRVLNGREFFLGNFIRVRHTPRIQSVVGLNVAGGIIDHNQDTSGEIYRHVRVRVESRFGGPSQYKHLLPLVYLT